MGRIFHSARARSDPAQAAMPLVSEQVDWMEPAANGPAAESDALVPDVTRGRLFRRYVTLFLVVMGLALIPKGLLDIWFSYQEQKTLLVRIQSEQAKSAAEKIGQFVKEIEGQMAWATQPPLQDKIDNEWRLDAVRLLRQTPALTEVAHLDANGRERYRMSRQAMDVIGSLRDFSQNPIFTEAIANKVYYGPVYFLRESEPYMTLAMAGAQRDYGVIVGQVNLKFIWDVVSQFKIDNRGEAYVVDAQGRLIAHPDISLVLRNTDLSRLAQVQAARKMQSPESSDQSGVVADLKGRKVLSAYALVAPLGWLVFAEMPVEEAYGPLYNTLIRSGLLLLAGLMLAFLAGLFLARRMVVPIRTLSEGAARIGSGDLTQRIAIKTGDELEALGNQFNSMTARLQDSYATLERKVEERTRQLEVANLAKSRFLAAASHDLRQPLHALGLFVAQLCGRTRADERRRIITRINAALSAMNELFNALLDVSKLDAGVLIPQLTEFPTLQLLKRIETTFAGAAREKGLSFRVVTSGVWVRSDFILLERIVFNLVSNAVRYTAAGGLVVGCRRRNGQLRIEIWDTGNGIPQDQHQRIFGEFYRLSKHDRDQRGGLGLGLAIVDRLCRLLKHPIELKSTLGKGSCFSVAVPMVHARAEVVKPLVSDRSRFNITNGKLVVVIDDDPLVLDGMGGLIRSWGCRVVTASTDSAALSGLLQYDHPPDVIISDYHLCDGITGIEVITRLRSALSASIPAFLMSGDTNPKPLFEAQANGYPLLHKPVDPMALRATLTQVLKRRQVVHIPLKA
jgi:signal transduction histidine kinase